MQKDGNQDGRGVFDESSSIARLYADEAIHLGPAPSNQSYLLGDKIIEKPKLGVNGIHPECISFPENAFCTKS